MDLQNLPFKNVGNSSSFHYKKIIELEKQNNRAQKFINNVIWDHVKCVCVCVCVERDYGINKRKTSQGNAAEVSNVHLKNK